MNEELDIIFDLAKESMSNAITHLEKKINEYSSRESQS